MPENECWTKIWVHVDRRKKINLACRTRIYWLSNDLDPRATWWRVYISFTNWSEFLLYCSNLLFCNFRMQGMLATYFMNKKCGQLIEIKKFIILPKILSVLTIFAGQPFPPNFIRIAQTIMKRLFRVYTHIYHQHLDLIGQKNTCINACTRQCHV